MVKTTGSDHSLFTIYDSLLYGLKLRQPVALDVRAVGHLLSDYGGGRHHFTAGGGAGARAGVRRVQLPAGAGDGDGGGRGERQRGVRAGARGAFEGEEVPLLLRGAPTSGTADGQVRGDVHLHLEVHLRAALG